MIVTICIENIIFLSLGKMHPIQEYFINKWNDLSFKHFIKPCFYFRKIFFL